jgi:hypothetical protein
VDRKQELSGEKKDRSFFFMINDKQLETYRNSIPFVPLLLEYHIIKCRMHYLPRSFSSVIVTAMYIPPQVDPTSVLKELHGTMCKLDTTYPEAPFILAGEFNKGNLRKPY